jgi:hypothetical protein
MASLDPAVEPRGLAREPVGAVAGFALARGWELQPLGPAWFLAHTLTAVAALAGAFVLAGLAGRVEVRLARARFGDRGAVLASVAAALLVLHISVTGFATWWGPGALGLPGSSGANLCLLWLVWLGRGRGDTAG